MGHIRIGGGVVLPTLMEGTTSTGRAVGPAAGPSGAAGGGSAPQGPTAGPSGAGATTSQTSSGSSRTPNRTSCLDLPIEEQSISNIHLRQIVEKCMLIGKYGIENINRRSGLGFA